jgi:dolichol-phosphate mannosyltransferase
LNNALTVIGRTFEILLIDDRSPDGSWPAMVAAVAKYPAVRAIRLSRNFGQHYAITAGLDIAEGEWVVVMDCDLQDQPEEIGKLLTAGESGFDIVLARRVERNDTILKRLLSRVFYKAFNLLSGYNIDPTVGSFRLMHRSVVEAYRGMRETSRLFGGMIEWLGFETTYVDVDHASRYEGKTSYSLRALTKLAVDGIVSFSNRPLYLSIGIGIAISLAAGAFGGGLVVMYLVHPRIGVPGWLSTITLSSFIGGLILLNQGVLGIYLGRIYDQTKARPLYVVDRVVANAAERVTATSATDARREVR